VSCSVSWAQSWKDICAYDSFCSHLKNTDGSFKQAKPEVLALLRKLKPVIDKAARDYDVDPRAIAGAILAENSLNVQISDTLQEYLVKLKLTKTGTIFGTSFSFGLGQIQTATAYNVEALAAKIENRPLRTESEVAQSLTKPEDAIKYAAAIIKNTQDIYKANGMDISKDLAVLTTLYNVGKPELRVLETKKLGGKPKPNYFGFFVNQNIQIIEKSGIKSFHQPLLTPSIPITTQVSLAPESSNNKKQSTNFTKPLAKKELPKKVDPIQPEKKVLNSEPNPETEKLTKVTRVESEIVLSRGPSSCLADGSGNEGEQKRWNSFKSYDSVAVLKPPQKATIIGEGLGCEMTDWILVKNEKGDSGWIKKEVYENSTKTSYENENTCVSNNTDCQSKLEKIKQFKPLDDEESKESRSNFLQLSLVGENDITWKRPANQCLDKEDQKNRTKDTDGVKPVKVASGQNLKNLINGEEKDWAKKALDEIQDIKLQSLALLNQNRSKVSLPPLEKWESEENPFYPILKRYDDWAIPPLTTCASSEYVCKKSSFFNPDEFKKLYTKTISSDYSSQYLWSIASGHSYGGNIYENALYLGKVKDTPEWLAEKELALGSLEKCHFISEKSVTRDVLKAIKSYVQKNGVNNIEISYPYNDTNNHPLNTLQMLGEYCEKIISPNRSVVEKPSKEYCEYAGHRNLPKNAAIIKLTMAHLNQVQKEDKTLEVISDWTNTVRSQLDMSKLMKKYTQNQDSYGLCGYNQFKTAKLIEELLKNKCVSNVYIQDPWILNYFAEKSNKVIYQAYNSENRFSVELNHENCN